MITTAVAATTTTTATTITTTITTAATKTTYYYYYSTTTSVRAIAPTRVMSAEIGQSMIVAAATDTADVVLTARRKSDPGAESGDSG